jgi:hypothetical protein
VFGFMGDDFVESLVRLESCLPGSVFGVVDIACNQCGQVSTHRPNANGSTKYICPTCGATVEV